MENYIATGHITKNASTRTVMVKGTPVLVTDFTVAVNRGHGENQKTKFIVCSIWRDRGAKLAQYLVKGRLVTVQGNLDARAWTPTKGEFEGKPQVQFIMSNPEIDLPTANPAAKPDDDEIPFLPDEDLDA